MKNTECWKSSYGKNEYNIVNFKQLREKYIRKGIEIMKKQNEGTTHFPTLVGLHYIYKVHKKNKYIYKTIFLKISIHIS